VALFIRRQRPGGTRGTNGEGGSGKGTAGALQTRLARFLLTYGTTGVPPSQLMMGRPLRTLLDLVRPDVSAAVTRRQEAQKLQHDRGARARSFEEGDDVVVRDFTGQQKWLPASISRQTAPLSYECRLPDDRIVRRHADHVASAGVEPLTSGSTELPINDELRYESAEAEVPPLLPPTPPPPHSHRPRRRRHAAAASSDSSGARRSQRNRKCPDRLTYNSPNRRMQRRLSAVQLAQQLFSSSSGRSSPRNASVGGSGGGGGSGNERERTWPLLRWQPTAGAPAATGGRYTGRPRPRFSRDREARQGQAREKLAKLTREKDEEIESLMEQLNPISTFPSRIRSPGLPQSAELRGQESRPRSSAKSVRLRAESERFRLEAARLEEKLEAAEQRLTAAKGEADRARKTGNGAARARRRQGGAEPGSERARDELQAEAEGAADRRRRRRVRDFPQLPVASDSPNPQADPPSPRWPPATLRWSSSPAGSPRRIAACAISWKSCRLTCWLGASRRAAPGQRRPGAADPASLAAEIDLMNKEEREGRHQKLRSYIDRILLKIMEKQPELLEIGMASTA
uniref:FIP-RBD domain-containing protein n=1 Tax=Macrostomum lignano TaxID=282301 RepID=A0A1I8FHD3_9PLAT